MMSSLQLSTSECCELLDEGTVGRVAVCTPLGPRIVPVSYSVHDAAIVFRTAPYSELSTYGWDADLAFEVDALDQQARTGWSVVAIGRAHVVADPDEVLQIRREHAPQPWAPGSRNLYVKLAWRQITGVRLGAGPPVNSTRTQRRTV
jgi:nitroimidazol reductase NimA-like FMN-containing flavoprotein (pyridoxamine 5'-phosphate oxidase superfamily)